MVRSSSPTSSVSSEISFSRSSSIASHASDDVEISASPPLQGVGAQAQAQATAGALGREASVPGSVGAAAEEPARKPLGEGKAPAAGAAEGAAAGGEEAKAGGGGFSRSSSSSSIFSMISDMGQGNEDGQEEGISSASTSTARPVVGALGRAAAVPAPAPRRASSLTAAARPVVGALGRAASVPGSARVGAEEPARKPLGEVEAPAAGAAEGADEEFKEMFKKVAETVPDAAATVAAAADLAQAEEAAAELAAAQKAAKDEAEAKKKEEEEAARLAAKAQEDVFDANDANEFALQMIKDALSEAQPILDAPDQESDGVGQVPKRALSVPVPGGGGAQAQEEADEAARLATEVLEELVAQAAAKAQAEEAAKAELVAQAAAEAKKKAEAAAAKAQADKEAAAELAAAQKVAEAQVEEAAKKKKEEEDAAVARKKEEEDKAEEAKKLSVAIGIDNTSEELLKDMLEQKKKIDQELAAAQKKAEEAEAARLEAQNKAKADLEKVLANLNGLTEALKELELQKNKADFDLANAQSNLEAEKANAAAALAAQKVTLDAALAASQKEVADLKAALAAQKVTLDAALAASQKEVADLKAAAATATGVGTAAGAVGGGGGIAPGGTLAPAPSTPAALASATLPDDWRKLYESKKEYEPDDDEHKEKKSALFYANSTNSTDPNRQTINFGEINNFTEIGKDNVKPDFVLRINKVKFEEGNQPTFGDNTISSLSSIDFNSRNTVTKGGYIYGKIPNFFNETNKIHISEKSANRLRKYQKDLYNTALNELKSPTTNSFSDDTAERNRQLQDLCDKIIRTAFPTDSTTSQNIFSTLQSQISGTRNPPSTSNLVPGSDANNAIFEKMAEKIADNIVQNRLLVGDYKIHKKPTAPASAPAPAPAPEELPAIKITRNNDDKHRTKIKIDATGKFDDSLKFLYINFGQDNEYYLRIELESSDPRGSNKNKIKKDNSLKIFTQQGNKNKFKSLYPNEPDFIQAIKEFKKYKIDIITSSNYVTNDIFERTRITKETWNNSFKTTISEIYSTTDATLASPITLAQTRSWLGCCSNSKNITATNNDGKYELENAHGRFWNHKIKDSTYSRPLVNPYISESNVFTAIKKNTQNESDNDNVSITLEKNSSGFFRKTKSSIQTWAKAMIEQSNRGVVSSVVRGGR
jgi:hypothetical protein